MDLTHPHEAFKSESRQHRNSNMAYFPGIFDNRGGHMTENNMLLSLENCPLLIVKKKKKTSVIILQGCSYSRDCNEQLCCMVIWGKL